MVNRWTVYKIRFNSGKEFIDIAQDWKWTDIVDYCKTTYKSVERLIKIGDYKDYQLAKQAKKDNFVEYKPKPKFKKD